MKRTLKILTLLIVTCGLISCNQIKRKSEQINEKVKDKTIRKIFPPFNHDKPDTENNQRRFKDFLKVEITSDVRNIYCFDDAIGIDTDYMFSFNCDSSTSKKIIEVNELKVDSINTDNGFYLQHDFTWWNKERIAKLKKYSWTNGDRYFKYYWYDKENVKPTSLILTCKRVQTTAQQSI